MAITIPLISTFDNKGVKGAIKEFQSLEGAGKKAQFALGKASKVASGALLGLAGAAGLAAKAAAEDQASQIKLADALKKSGDATDAQVAATEEFISKLSMSAAVADDELRPAMANLVRATGSATAAQEALAIATDVAAQTGMSVESVSKALSKAYAGNTTALKKLNPQLGNLIDKGDSAAKINQVLTKQFGGSAAKATKTAAGRMKQLQIAVGEAQESIGSALLPVVEAVAPKLAGLAQWAQNNPEVFKNVAIAIGAIATAVLVMTGAFKIYNAAQALTTAVNTALATSFSALWVATGVGIILAVIAALAILQAKFNIFGKAIDGIKIGFNVVWDTVKTVFGWVKDNWPLLLAVLTGPFGMAALFVVKFKDQIVSVFKSLINAVGSLWNNTIGKFSIKIPSWVPGIGGKGFDVPDIPKLADGGIVTGPTLALIGEAGPEAVVPLDRAGAMGTEVTINVHSADPQAVVDALRRYMRVNGAIPIRTTAVA